VPGVNAPAENALAVRARAILSTWQDMADLVRLGAYKPGTDPLVDEAVRLAPRIEAFLAQAKDQACPVGQGFAELEQALCP
jgi:flagellum-specific ATP synthase